MKKGIRVTILEAMIHFRELCCDILQEVEIWFILQTIFE